MSNIATRQRASEADYEAIELAVNETERGRWFLAEYAKRNRHSDTQTLLSALSRIERAVTASHEAAGIDKVRVDILEMSKAIARTHAEIAAIKAPEDRGGPICEASGELDSIVFATEAATSDILAAAEQVQEAAWTLREAGSDHAICDLLDSRATEIYTACSFQDLTAQRTRKVIETLSFLEGRLSKMVAIWQFAESDEPGPRPQEAASSSERDAGMSQADVDDVLVGEDFFAAPSASAAPPEAIDEILFTEPEPAARPVPERLQLVSNRTEPQAEGKMAAAPPSVVRPEIDDVLRKARSGVELSPDEAARALDTLQGLSVEERTRLFS